MRWPGIIMNSLIEPSLGRLLGVGGGGGGRTRLD